jgi:hypothetical protein
MNFLERVATALEKIANPGWTHGDIIAILNVAVLILTLAVLWKTLVAVVGYTTETKRLREATESQITKTTEMIGEAQEQNRLTKTQNEINTALLNESQKQTRLSVLPILGLYGIDPGPTLTTMVSRVVLENVGRGPAFNVSIDDVVWGNRSLEFKVDPNVLRVGDTQGLQLILKKGGFLKLNILTPGSLVDQMLKKEIPNPFEVVVRCHDLNLCENSYSFAFRLNEENLLRVTYQSER